MPMVVAGGVSVSCAGQTQTKCCQQLDITHRKIGNDQAWNHHFPEENAANYTVHTRFDSAFCQGLSHQILLPMPAAPVYLPYN